MNLTTEQLDELEAALEATESPAIIVGRDHLRNIIAAARREKKLREALRDLYDQVDSLNNYELSKDLPLHEAEMCWADALYSAREALKDTQP